MFNISFGSNYKINVGSKFPYDTMDKIYDYELKGGKIYEKYTNIEEAKKTGVYQKLNVCLPDNFDIDFEAYLISKGIPFKKETTEEATNLENIKKRICLSYWAQKSNYELVEIDTNKLNELFKQDGISYIEPNGKNGICNRYKQVSEYLKTGEPINASEIIFREEDGELKASINDGRHRFAYLRDMGIKRIPVAINKDSYDIAKKYGLI